MTLYKQLPSSINTVAHNVIVYYMYHVYIMIIQTTVHFIIHDVYQV